MEIEKQCKKLCTKVLSLRSRFEELEENKGQRELETEILSELNGLARDADNAQERLQSEHSLPQTRRKYWLLRISQIIEECNALRRALGDKYERQSKQMRKDEETAQILQYSHHNSNHQNNLKLLSNQSDTSIDMQHLVSEGISLRQSHSMADQLLDMGGNILSELGIQRERLKDIQRRVLDFTVVLGLSSSLLRVIERRQFSDKLLVYGGMIFCLVVFFYCYFTFR